MSSPLSSTASRRRFLGLGALGLGAAGAGIIGLSASAPHSALAQTAPTTGPWTGGVPAASYSGRQMAIAAKAFLASLNADLSGRVVFPDLGDASRTKWSNFPAGASPRAGVSMGDFSDIQRILVHNLLRASTSSQGYLKMSGSLRMDEVLGDTEKDTLFGASNFYVSIFGSPDSGRWAWMLTGHHMSAVFTVADDRMAFTPMFTGAQPYQVPTGIHAGWQTLPQEVSRANELLTTLTTDQQSTAIIGTSAPGDVIAGPGRQDGLSSFMGIPTSKLDDSQQHLLWLLIQEYVRNADFDAAEAQLALIQSSWGDTHFAWIGPPPSLDARFYYRVHGPRILIEFDVQGPLNTEGGHVHAITRDPSNDYGADWLGLHYAEPAGGGVGGGTGGPPAGGPRGAAPTPTP